jgi:hypothetical protein
MTSSRNGKQIRRTVEKEMKKSIIETSIQTVAILGDNLLTCNFKTRWKIAWFIIFKQRNKLMKYLQGLSIVEVRRTK